MAENNSTTERARALRAEKQVERLERELELIRSRLKKPNGPAGSNSPNMMIRESDKVNFQLQEQVKDLKYQLKHQTAEHSKLQETLATKTSEYEDKLKRMREIFGQASKNIDNYRASIASKDVEIGNLKLELEECQQREQSYKSTSESQQLTIEKLNTEITSTKTFYGTEIKQLEAKNRQISVQFEQTKSNYEQYKKRAHILLEKNKEKQNDTSRINQLQELVEQLQHQKSKYEHEQQEKAEQRLLMEHDLRKAIDRINELESMQHVLVKTEASFSTEKNALETKLQAMTKQFHQTSQQLTALQTKYDEQIKLSANSLEPLKLRLQELQETNDSLYQQLLIKDNEIEKLIISTPTSPPPADEVAELPPQQKPQQQSPPATTPPLAQQQAPQPVSDVYASMSSLLSPLVSRQMPDERIGLEKQVQRLSEMLHESQDKITALQTQEKVLKDELRKMDAFEKRQDMNVEYLKNVLVKFLMSENKQMSVEL
ncbi:hypothetical protein HMPREF1544_08617 [Mucor circinelloides 1006PhL]|uniref:GRIP domain-containing protein n=1 Tax=Mucor circinelloides f. circinelloides (strain 1006PhL) TaxID=1220926 RepID=S2JXM5_MUCC1|nr:hypothetical protein HMPREF1544_08617 [Mucor circinelloides 1006PhL]